MKFIINKQKFKHTDQVITAMQDEKKKYKFKKDEQKL